MLIGVRTGHESPLPVVLLMLLLLSEGAFARNSAIIEANGGFVIVFTEKNDFESFLLDNSCAWATQVELSEAMRSEFIMAEALADESELVATSILDELPPLRKTLTYFDYLFQEQNKLPFSREVHDGKRELWAANFSDCLPQAMLEIANKIHPKTMERYDFGEKKYVPGTNCFNSAFFVCGITRSIGFCSEERSLKRLSKMKKSTEPKLGDIGVLSLGGELVHLFTHVSDEWVFHKAGQGDTAHRFATLDFARSFYTEMMSEWEREEVELTLEYYDASSFPHSLRPKQCGGRDGARAPSPFVSEEAQELSFSEQGH